MGAKSVAIAKEKNNQADDSLVRMGGITSDEEDEEAEQVAFNAAASVPRGKANVMPSNIRITPGKQVMTKTDLRGGSKKWNLNHIPTDAKDVFSDKVVPLVKAKVGTMEPWASIDLKGLQKIVDDVFGDEGYELSAGDAWTSLISYRLQSWRNRFAAKARKAVARYFDDPQNNLQTAEARLEAVKEWLDFEGADGEGTAPYQFKKCIYDEDNICRTRGFCQAPFIIETFALAHLKYINSVVVLWADDPPHKQPIGAMILSLQAVEHALRQYEEDGFCDEGSTAQFSFDNYSDCTLVQEVNGRSIQTFDPRASRYIAPIHDGFEERHWANIFRNAQEVLALKG
ncbi:hypothetical protein H0H92_011270, partial [Tricholoma furcatifolium]